MKKLLPFLFFAGALGAQTLYKNVQKTTDGTNGLVENLTVPAARTLTLSGIVTGTPASGTLNLSNTTLTLPTATTALFQPVDADLTSIAGNITGGFLTRTAANTYLARTLTGTNNEITVTAGDGVAGAPTLSLPSSLTFTGKTVTGGSLVGLTGLGLRSTGTGAFDLTLANTENLTLGRTLTITTGNASRTFTLTGDATLTGTNTGDQTLTLTGDATGSGTGSFAVNVGKINGVALSGLATGVLKNTTTTGVPSIAVAGDFPTLNQNTTGSASTLTTPRAIYGNNFDGSTALTQVISSTYGGTGNGFTKFTGPTLTEKIFTLPDASSTLLYAGGAISGTTGTFSGAITGPGSTTGGLTLGNASGNTGASVHLLGSNTTVNWQLASQTQQTASFTITPSTTNGGNTYTTPIALFTSTGLAVTGTVSATTRLSCGTGALTNAQLNIGFVGTSEGYDALSNDDASGATFAVFRKSTGVAIGSINRVTTTDAVAYNTTSDGRLKTNVRDFTAADSGRIIDGLRPRWFDWKPSELNYSVEEIFDTGKRESNGTPVMGTRSKLVPVTDSARRAKHAADSTSIIGFVAQEEAAVDPALVRIGAVTEGDNDPTTITKQWQRSDSALVPILVAELKALRARVAALEARP